jgi:hypothetical protein
MVQKSVLAVIYEIQVGWNLVNKGSSGQVHGFRRLMGVKEGEAL